LTKGGRIWWISRQVRQLMGRSMSTKYISITVIISIESGILYAASLVGFAVSELVVNPSSQRVIPFDPEPLMMLMAGLAPTLIIV
ncbi:hypothetical protein L218DRAFT_836458, partial [Marasmius fiardii PR-910]